MDKVYPSVDEAVADIPDGATIAISGFFTAGTPAPLIQALARRKVKDLTIICQQMGPGNGDINQLISNDQVKKAICNYPFYRSVSQGANSPFEKAVRTGQIDLEIYPMGTFIEKLRAAAAGLAAFYTPTGVGTVIETGKEKRRFGDREYLLEIALKPDYAFVYAYQGDRMGNLVCRKTARNYNPEMAAAARVTIAAVENVVEVGRIDPDKVHIPGIYVQRVVKVDRPSYYPGID
ncbi:MAG: 3-oxoacid CoA-transferase subunit A [Dehalococcoidales bacterium]|nr:3-oxoacid CoA-transferase subunit A [Dehalococcoidales bacterium]